jgi:hypothetical protein
VQFSRGLESVAAPLFRKQVMITGTVHYFEHRIPKLIVESIEADIPRDYERAFEELWGIDKEILGDQEFNALLEARYGDG